MDERICERAAKEIAKDRPKRGIQKELDRIGIPSTVYSHWKHGHYGPSAYYLQQMVLAGYDVIYILTGVRNG